MRTMGRQLSFEKVRARARALQKDASHGAARTMNSAYGLIGGVAQRKVAPANADALRRARASMGASLLSV